MFDGDHHPDHKAPNAAAMNRVVSELTGEPYPPKDS